MSSRTISVVLKAQIDNYRSQMQAAERHTREVERAAMSATQRFREHNEALDKLGKGFLVGGAAASAAVVLVAKATAEYGAKMAQLKSLSGATRTQMDQLSQAAMTQGQAFGQSAMQVADAEIELTKAGRSAAQIMGGDLRGALALAAAGQLDVGKATQIGVTALTQFSQQGATIPHVADLLAAGADKALGSVEDLGMALNQGGLVASQMGVSLDETTGTLSAFAQAGLLGSDAGTSMKTMLLALQSPTDQAAGYLKQYNIHAYDTEGHFVGMAKLAGQLKAGFANASDAERDMAMSTIFGSDAIRSANVLFKEGASGIRGWTRDVNDQGFAAAQAAGKMDSLQGDLTKLSAAFETATIKAGTSADGGFRGIVQGATNVVTTISSIPGPVQGVVVGMTALGGAAAIAGGAALIAIPKVAAFRAELTRLEVSGRRAAGIVGKAGGLAIGVLAIGTAFASAGERASAGEKEVTDALNRLKTTGAKGIKDSDFTGDFMNSFTGFKDAVGQMGSFNQSFAHGFGAPLKALTGGAIDLASGYEKAERQLNGFGQALATTADEDLPRATQGFNDLVKRAGGGREAIKHLADAMPDYRDKIVQLLTAQKIAATEQNVLNAMQGKGAAGAKILAAAQEAARHSAERQAEGVAGLAGKARGATQDLGDLEKAIEGFGSAQLDARSATAAMEQAIADATKKIANNKKGIDLHTQAGRDNDEMLRNIASSTAQAAGKTLALTGSADKAADSMREGRKGFILAANAAGITGHAAEVLADKYGLIPKNIHTAVDVTGTDLAEAKVKALRDALAGVHNKSVTVSVNADGSVAAAYSDARESAGLPKVKKAAGGAIDGPGPRGVDSVPALLAPGEHVLTTRDVDALGGQAGVYALRASLASGDVQRYAKGGAVHKRKRRSAAHHVAAAHPHHSTRITDHSRIGAAHPHATRTVHKRPKKPKMPTGAQLAYAAVQWGGRVTANKKTGKIVRENDIHRQDRLGHTASHEVSADKKALARAKTAAKTAARREASAQKRYDAIGSGKKDAAAKKAARAALNRAKAASKKADGRVTAAEKERDKDTTRRDAAKASAHQLRLDREDFVSAERRDPTRRTTDPLAYVDQLRSMSRDDNFSKGRRRKFDDAANAYEKQLVTLTARSAKAAEKLSNLKESSQQLHDSIKSAVQGSFSASAAGSTAQASGWMTRNGMRFRTYSTAPTAAGIAGYYSQSADKAKRFAADLAKLKARGLKAELLTEIAGYGVEAGQPIVTALLAGTTAQIQQVNAGYTAIGTAAGAAGTTVADANFAKQIASAKADADQITGQIKDDGEKLRKMIATAFGLKGYATGTTSAEGGVRWVGENGPELVGFRGGEAVLNAAASQRWVRGAPGAGGGGSSEPVVVQAAPFPDTITIADASGFSATMRVVATQVVNQRHDELAVRLIGATA